MSIYQFTNFHNFDIFKKLEGKCATQCGDDNGTISQSGELPESQSLDSWRWWWSIFVYLCVYDELREDVMIWVLETRIFESDQNEFQSVVPTLYVVKICGNCILNAKNSKKQFKRPISLFSLCAVESSLLKRPIFDENSQNENAFFSMFSTGMT